MSKYIEEEIIIPDENQVDIKEYRGIVYDNIRHGNIVKEFSDLYNLGLTFKDIGVEEDNYNGYMWSKAISILGHVAIQKSNTIIFYLPNIITDKQYEYFKEHKKELTSYKKKQDISILNTIIEDDKVKQVRISHNHISDYEDITEILYDLIEEKHIKKEKDDLDVRGIRH